MFLDVTMNRIRTIVGLVALLMIAGISSADEGMWLFNRPPRKELKERYAFDPSDAWLEHVQKSSVRFNSGGSGSFVSADGLVMTNHHVGADCLQKLSDSGHNYLRDGFYARARAEEKRCHDLELNVLMNIEDVTQRVNAVIKPGMTSEEAFSARRAVMNEIESESTKKTGFRSDVVTLYQGAEYDLYRYRVYTDVRVVFAPEQQIAFFGGDPDNFEYPRFDLDCCFFRVYEDGKPAKIEHYFKWSRSGAAENELIFVSGHPGHTDRLNTLAALNYLRETGFPYLLQRMYRWEVLLSSWSGRSEENARKAKEFLFGVQNTRKAREGELAGLLDPALMAKKKTAEEKLRAAVAKDSTLHHVGSAWDRIAAAQKVRAAAVRRYTILERAAGFNSELFDIARTLVRAAEERPKPDRDRLREFAEAKKRSLELKLFSTEPLYNDYEILKLTDSLTWLTSQFRDQPQFVLNMLDGKSPQERATELVLKTKVGDVAVRKQLYDAGQKAIVASEDPMIVLARSVDPPARAIRKTMESKVDEVERQAYAQIAKAKYATEGTNSYPDATFSLRLAFGTVRGYEEEGKQIPFETRIAGLYERSREHHDRPPFDLPQTWIEQKSKLDLNTPFNFVSTADIIGGNSGSPVVNKEAEVVGLIFDGNIQSLALEFVYTDVQARALAVCSQAIVEALRNVYDAGALADELTGKN
jgi:hypothetical protein